MSDTLETEKRHRGGSAPRSRVTWIATAGVLVVAVAGLALAKAVFADDAGSGEQRVLLSATEHTVTYEMSGIGIVPDLSYVVGEQNKTVDLAKVTVPWKETIMLPVGPAGGFAQISVTSPETGEGSLGCRIFLDGVLANQQTSTDGYAGVVCSVPIRAQFVN